MGNVGLLLAAWLGSAPVADELIFVAGRVFIEQAATHRSSRRFELTLQKRRGRILGAHACIFADLDRDRHWEGSCFALEPFVVDTEVGHDLFTADLRPVDRAAQHLLRLLAEEAYDHLPEGTRMTGYDPAADFQVELRRVAETDL